MNIFGKLEVDEDNDDIHKTGDNNMVKGGKSDPFIFV